MSQDTAITIDLLNTLLAAEARSMVRRLGESQPFIGQGPIEQTEIVPQLLAEHSAITEAITEEILRLRGCPAPSLPDASSAGLHYLDLQYLLPQVIESEKQTVRVYESVIARLEDAGLTAPLAQDLLNRHQQRIARLEAFQPQPQPPADEEDVADTVEAEADA